MVFAMFILPQFVNFHLLVLKQEKYTYKTNYRGQTCNSNVKPDQNGSKQPQIAEQG